MNRAEFMFALGKLLADIPYEERCEALAYYENYFEDAGSENEAAVIQELGSPQKVAEIIRADFGEEIGGEKDTAGEFGERGFTDARFENYSTPAVKEETWGSSSKVILLIVLGIFAFPFIAGLFGTLVGLVASLVGVLAALVVAAGSIAVAGIGLVIGGFASLAYSFPVALMLLGSGLILLVIGTILTIGAVKLCVLICITLFPAMFRWIRNLFSRIFQRKVV
ncbi:MAG: DUF1700 domain-containing protein [Lachnospiraceae bacterium]|nr:DUF1700 domain-containing protein [Lachnospiraceae bacterium]